MEEFKGTGGEWSADIGADDLHDDLLQVMVISYENDFCVAHAYGKTYDEAMANAKAISQTKNALDAMAKFCRRVEAGEVRSKTTYLQFKEILEYAGYIKQ